MRTVYYVDDAPAKKPRRKGRMLGLKERLPTPVQLVLEGAFWPAMVLLAVALLYYGYAIFAGDNFGLAWFGRYQNVPALHAQRAHMIGNLGIFGVMLVVATSYLSIYLFVAAFEYEDRFLILAAAFLLFHFGVPILFSTALSDTVVFSPGYLQPNYADQVVLHYFQLAGNVCLAVGVVRLIIGIVDIMKNGTTRLKAVVGQREKEGPAGGKPAARKAAYRLMSRCWETSYCQDFLLPICPAWQKKKTCWKAGAGCMCDSTMVERLIQIQVVDSDRRDALPKNLPTARRYSGPNKCHSCPIYLVHQEEKFRVVNPLMLLTVLALLVVYWDGFLHLYEMLVGAVGRLIASFSLGPASFVADQWRSNFLDPFVEDVLVVCLALVVVSMALRFVEWAVLKKKL